MNRRLVLAGACAAALGFVLLAVGFALEPRRAAFAYLAAYAYGVTIAAGALLFLAVGHVSRATWFVALRPTTEAVAATLPAFALLVLPLLLSAPRLYPWAAPLAALEAPVREAVAQKRAYLNTPFFVARTAGYLLLWTWLALALVRAPREREPRAVAAELARKRDLAAPAIPALILTGTFAAFDWLMSLEPAWSSNVYGAYVLAGGLLAAVAVVAVLAALARRAGELPPQVAESHFHALGNVLLTGVAVWAYLGFCQYLLLWIADIPREIVWYRARAQGAWRPVAVALALGQFALPFLALLFRAVTRSPARLAVVAAYLALVHYVDVYWLVLPALHPDRVGAHWLDAAALLAVVGSALAYGAYRARARELVPRADPRLAASLRYEAP